MSKDLDSFLSSLSSIIDIILLSKIDERLFL
jgi:hypothetical protein